MDQTGMLEDMFNSHINLGESGLASFANYLRGVHLSNKTLPIFFNFFEKGTPKSLDSIFMGREPSLFFSTLTPDRDSLSRATQILVSLKPRTADYRVILAMLGLLILAYKKGEEGLGIKPLTVSELQHIGKYLVRSEEAVLEMVLDLLDSISLVSSPSYGDLAALAGEMRIAHFDHSKKLSDHIPSTLLM